MKLDRRAFVKLIAGGVGGTLLSPLPWQLADDTAIWSQNWSWRPSPKGGADSLANTVCQLCPGGCGIRVRLIENKRAVRIDGNPSHPVNQGGLCPLAGSGLQFHYGLSRIESPLRQTGKRGDLGSLEPIGWDEALGILAAQMKSMRQQPQGLACLTARGGGTVAELFARFLQAYGSPNYLAMPSYQDTESLGLLLTQGESGSLAYDLENSRLVVSFGSEYLEGWGSPGRMLTAFNVWRSRRSSGHTRIIHVGTRGSLSASKADEWVAVAPGTEAALALGLAHVIVREGLYDQSFVNQHSFGFKDWTDANGRRRQGFESLILKDYSPKRVAGITGVAEERIVSLAREFARTKPAAALSGHGRAGLPGALYDFLAVQSLNALVGSLHQPGGVGRSPKPPLAPWPEVIMDETARGGFAAPRLDGAGEGEFPLPGRHVYRFFKRITEGGPYAAKMLWVHEANPVHDLPDVKLVRAALDKVDTVVSFSPYLDETTAMADLILPGPSFVERLEDGPAPRGLQYAVFNLSHPVLTPRFETRHPGDALIQLAASLGGSVAKSFPWKDYESALKDRVQGLAAAGSGQIADTAGARPWTFLGKRLDPNYGSFRKLWDKLIEFGCWFDTSMGMPSWKAAFKTPSGKFEFACQRLQELGVTGDDLTYLPHYEPVAPAGDPAAYPLLLMPYETMTIVSQGLANPPFMTKLLFDFELKGNDSFVEINPETAAREGLREGDRVRLETEQGEVQVRVHLTEAARPGVLFIPMGLGHSAFDRYIRGKGVNPNEILVPQEDPITGLATLWGTRVRIQKA